MTILLRGLSWLEMALFIYLGFKCVDAFGKDAEILVGLDAHV